MLALFGLALRAGGSDSTELLAVAPPGSPGASELTLAPDLSFTDDSSGNFPIRGRNLTDGRIASDRPTIVFYGTSHCWNTNREAERFVALYAKRKDRARFLVVDLEQPSADQRRLMRRFYGGRIPHITVLDARGEMTYNRAGETARERGDTSALEKLLDEAAKR
jgi:hypothetical protein